MILARKEEKVRVSLVCAPCLQAGLERGAGTMSPKGDGKPEVT